ncbi:MAG: aldehyde dehydrogenase family protein [Bdellovibrionales bacterium]|nr:aldehyde dehydrogenase family protein [Bdellovibrionales bacterium]
MSSYKIINPYSMETVTEIIYTTKEEAFVALGLLEQGRALQKKMAPFQRADILLKLANLMRRDKDLIAAQITQEMGKTLGDSLVEMDRAITTITLSSQEAIRINGEVLNSDAFAPRRDKRGMVEYFPLGIVFAITPFNFPINLSVHKIGPAFAAGNCILFKPGPQNYLSGKMLTNLCHEAGMPVETFQMVNPDIPVMSELTRHPSVNCISFTGGVVAAKAIAQNAGLKKLLFELGGNDPLIVMPDGDVNLAIKTAINQRFGTAGQRCTASKKLYIHSSLYEEFKKKLIEETGKLVIGDPMKTETFVGPVVNARAADEIMRRLDQAVSMGGKILAGHKREGNIIHPTVIENVSDECDLVREETFGPVLPLMKFSSLDEVIEQLQKSAFGLQAGVFTHDLRVIKRLYEELEVGALAVNDGPGFRAEHFPFGGMKDSGMGREGVAYAIREMSALKTLIF